MKIEKYIFDSELDFRRCVILNHKYIRNIYVFEDNLEGIIYFYCIFLDGTFIATKEISKNNFSFYKEIYKKIKKELDLYADIENNKTKALKLKNSN